MVGFIKFFESYVRGEFELFLVLGNEDKSIISYGNYGMNLVVGFELKIYYYLLSKNNLILGFVKWRS